MKFTMTRNHQDPQTVSVTGLKAYINMELMRLAKRRIDVNQIKVTELPEGRWIARIDAPEVHPIDATNAIRSVEQRGLKLGGDKG